jgi:hypothetical protein
VIFGIGLSKTGTTSLFAALDQLGYRSGTYRHLRGLGLEEWFGGNFERDYLTEFDALTDLPLATFFPQLDARYPGSKFILTVREIGSWLESARKHFTPPDATSFGRDVRLATYGITGYDELRFRYVYEAHVRNVTRHFRDRPQSLLIMNIVDGEGWSELCHFLGREIPVGPFPHVQPGHRLPSEIEN